MLQRVYGTAWRNKEELEAYLFQLEEAEKRDHRKLGKQLDFYHMQDDAPGMVFWHPRGWVIWQEVEQYMRAKFKEYDYQEVRTPTVLDKTLWEKSGHWQNYRDNMFTTQSENRDYAVKPMNCPGHIQIFNSSLHSYRDLPLTFGGVWLLSPQRAFRFIAWLDARARLYARRCAYFLYGIAS